MLLFPMCSYTGKDDQTEKENERKGYKRRNDQIEERKEMIWMKRRSARKKREIG